MMSEPDLRAHWETRTVEEAVRYYRAMARENYNWLWAHEMFDAANYMARMAGLPEEERPAPTPNKPLVAAEMPPPRRRPATPPSAPVTTAETAPTPPLRRKPPPPAETPVPAAPSLFNLRKR